MVLLILSLLLTLVSSKSYTQTSLNSNCLNCINGGYDFCSLGTYRGPVDPISSQCCANMANIYDSCQTGYDACTWNEQTSNKFSKFFYCRYNSQCKVQGGITNYTVHSFNTAVQTIVMSKVQDVGPCKYVILNSMNQKAYINLTTDEPQNTVAFYAVIDDFLVTDRQYVNPTQTQLLPAVVTELLPNKHYQFGVVNLRAGVTYSLKYWRESNEYSAE
ncbi:hypothetical protein FGO68_gene6095 [Halteria grandinella]|uniref:Uncharacterized protein n=1 Tax=Halteria grandinella TaxID=5974 RepID=A0A8J8NEE3_HALGN|nr:hypothetical protein FGO68_gene6095 [Halteria grandinella]